MPKQSSCVITGGHDGTTPSISISKDRRGPKRGCLGHLSAPWMCGLGILSPRRAVKGEGDVHVWVLGTQVPAH